MYTEESILNCLTSLINEKNEVWLSDFVVDFRDEIVGSYRSDGGSRRSFKGGWFNKIKKVAKDSGLTLYYQRDNWFIIEKKLDDIDASNSGQ